MMKNVFYFNYINTIGGIEQFFAYLAEKYSDWDITILFRNGDKSQIDRLKAFVNVVRYVGQDIKCDTIFFCFNRDIIDQVDAKQKCLILHGDYGSMVEQCQLSQENLPIDDRIDKYYGVSQLVCDGWKSLTGLDCELVYNPFIQKPIKHMLRIVYCGRLTPEKGGNLANKFIERLDERHIDYQFYVYSDQQTILGKNVIYLNTRLDASQFLNPGNYDYIIVPSKNEGYCYSLIQALSNGLPAIVTPCPVFKELGADSTNSVTLDFNGNNIDDVIDIITTKKFKFKYIPKTDQWSDVLVKGVSRYVKPKQVTIEADVDYFDIDLNMHVAIGDKYIVNEYRANEIVERGFAHIL